ncbi:MAG: hypothetical protein JO328_08820 [Hyphomicrobiales bacterium]|nr:hypothetical protein [Hyphomicrobiales bacterium]MBV9429660.1 hypothetical protein [Bradyrhizobiaceae bacterium]
MPTIDQQTIIVGGHGVAPLRLSPPYGPALYPSVVAKDFSYGYMMSPVFSSAGASTV